LTRTPSTSSQQTSRNQTSDEPPVPALPATEDGQTAHVEGDEIHDAQPPKSPLLTQHRISTTSLDEVSLAEDDKSVRSLSSTATSRDSSKPPNPPPKLPSRGSGTTMQGLSGAFQVPFLPPPQAPAAAAPAPAAKSRSPFSFFTRGNTFSAKDIVSPPLQATRHDRSNTNTSITTIGSNPELMLNRMDGRRESAGSNNTLPRKTGKDQLKDRFKLVRMREEAGITSLGDDASSGEEHFTGVGGKGASLASRGVSPGAGDDQDADKLNPPPNGDKATSPTSPSTSTDAKLPPGIAVGVAAGPSVMHDPEAPVDWDLWQSVVYEGPAAVARTSAEELNRAISSGIPQAIRGVVWQVLAQSKNEELEGVYRDLVARGTDKEKERHSGSTVSANGLMIDENVLSSASSVRSDISHKSNIAPNGIGGAPSPSVEKDPEILAKEQAAALEKRTKKAKDDTAALVKLEKAIRRDLGARTSYSKYVVSSGLQEGLFGLCKAYALFDEGVGYAQGMNFLAMPLLFNVGLVFLFQVT
jgi:Rab-GTPase-TBC domain